MRILLLNVPHPSIGSRIPREHLPPLGLLAVGGPLLDAGHEVHLLDAELGPLSVDKMVKQAKTYSPDAVLFGHSGSSSGHPIVATVSKAIRAAAPKALIIYGGVYPTYHWRDVLEQERQIDIIVRGEGEQTTLNLIAAVENNTRLEDVRGIAFRHNGIPQCTADANLIHNLDSYRIGWELIDFDRYSYWGNKKAVVVQFSRGCPHNCNYCGQRLFWKKWRHRNPKAFAAELAWLHREHGVEMVNFADENPTSSRQAWKEFLEALIEENVPLILVGSTRADDIVRDANLLPLYKQAGVERFLLGIESYDENTLRKIKKGGTQRKDRQAIQLLRQHDIISMATYVVGFEEERHRDYWRSLRHLLSYDPDQIQLLYVTPHRWTPYFAETSKREVIQLDQRRWDYKHQVMRTKYMSPWLVLFWVKFIESVMQLRPKSLFRVLFHPDRSVRAAMRWYYSIGRKVWPYELWNFVFRDRRISYAVTLRDFWEAKRHLPVRRKEEIRDVRPQLAIERR